MKEKGKEILNIKDASSYLNCSVPTIRNLIKKQNIPYFKIGAKYYFSKDSIRKWITKNECSVL